MLFRSNSLIKDPTNSIKDLNGVLSKIAETYNLNKLLIKFLSFLISKRRFFYVQYKQRNFRMNSDYLVCQTTIVGKNYSRIRTFLR